MADNQQELAAALQAAWRDATVAPNVLYVPLRTFIYLRRPYMTKRGFRRWRARIRRAKPQL